MGNQWTNPWSQEEIQILKDNIIKYNAKQLHNLFLPNRAQQSIRNKAWRLKLLTDFGKIKCLGCNLIFTKNTRLHTYCSQRCEMRYKLKTNSQYRITHERQQAKSLKTFREKWGKVKRVYGIKKNEYPLVLASERFVAANVLPKNGFSNITLTREFSRVFPTDILAKKNNKICLIDVTLSHSKPVNKKARLLAKWLNAELYICHLSPKNFSYNYLIYVSSSMNSSSCRAKFSADFIKHIQRPYVSVKGNKN